MGWLVRKLFRLGASVALSAAAAWVAGKVRERSSSRGSGDGFEDNRMNRDPLR